MSFESFTQDTDQPVDTGLRARPLWRAMGLSLALAALAAVAIAVANAHESFVRERLEQAVTAGEAEALASAASSLEGELESASMSLERGLDEVWASLGEPSVVSTLEHRLAGYRGGPQAIADFIARTETAWRAALDAQTRPPRNVTSGAAARWLTSLVAGQDGLESLVLIDRFGAAVAASELPGRYDHTGEDGFSRALLTGEPALATDPGDPAGVDLFLPIESDGQVSGVMSARLDLGNMVELAAGTRLFVDGREVSSGSEPSDSTVSSIAEVDDVVRRLDGAGDSPVAEVLASVPKEGASEEIDEPGSRPVLVVGRLTAPAWRDLQGPELGVARLLNASILDSTDVGLAREVADEARGLVRILIAALAMAALLGAGFAFYELRAAGTRSAPPEVAELSARDLVEAERAQLRKDVETERAALMTSLDRLREELQSVVDGDLSRVLSAEGRGKGVDRLVSTSGGIVDGLRDVVSEGLAASAALDRAAVSARPALADLGAAQRDLLRTLEERAHALEGLSARLGGFAETAKAAGERSRSTQRSARGARESGKKLRTALEHASTSTSEGVRGLQTVTAATREMGETLELLTSLIERINIVALNASIKSASRAGTSPAGSARDLDGFAGDVERLSNRSSEAVARLEQLVNTIQTRGEAVLASSAGAQEETGRASSVVDDLLELLESLEREGRGLTRDLETLGESISDSDRVRRRSDRGERAVGKEPAGRIEQSCRRLDDVIADVARVAGELRESTSRYRLSERQDVGSSRGEGIANFAAR